MSMIDQANEDKRFIDFDEVKFSEAGRLTIGSMCAFVARMSPEEQARLIDTEGNLTQAAKYRAIAALFAKAYGDDTLTRKTMLSSLALKPKAWKILQALAIAAPALTKLATLEKGEDPRPIIASTANKAIATIQSGMNLKESLTQPALFEPYEEDEARRALLHLFATKRTAKTIAASLIEWAEGFCQEGTPPAR